MPSRSRLCIAFLGLLGIGGVHARSAQTAAESPAIGWSARNAGPPPSGHDPSRSAPTPALQFATTVCKPDKVVFGFLPYWSGTSNIRWDLLSHVGVFSLGVDAAGNLSNSIGWPWTATVNTAHASGVKVILTITNFSPSSILTLTTSPTARANFFTKLKAQLAAGNADGVCIDFEGSTSNNWPAEIPGFLQALRAYMASQSVACEIHIATPAVDWSKKWNLPAVAAQADYLFVMGYDFYGSWSTTTGPSAPLIGGSYNVTRTVDVEYSSVLATTPGKMILGAPWYGNQWTTSGSGAYASVVSFIQSVTYANAANAVATWGRRWDATSRTPWYRWQDASWNQVWYDDADSLGLKYGLAASRNLGGAGVWALGYQGSTSAMWDALALAFPPVCPCPADLTGDRFVDDSDFVAFSAAYNQLTCPPATACPGDLNDDGQVDDADFVLFAAAYDTLSCP